MTQEEKAKAYDEALERAKKELGTCGSQDCDAARQIFRLFPELKESGDEQSKKWILEYLYDGLRKSNEQFKDQFKAAIAWLEKQGKQGKQVPFPKFTFDDVLALQCCMETVKKVQEDNELYEQLQSLHDRLHDAYWLEKQGEQKETNFVKILKHYPRETELYSPLYGKLWLAEVDEENEIITCYKHPLDEGCTRATLEQENTVSFYSNGTTGLPDFNISKDCMLFLYDIEKQGESLKNGE